MLKLFSEMRPKIGFTFKMYICSVEKCWVMRFAIFSRNIMKKELYAMNSGKKNSGIFLLFVLVIGPNYLQPFSTMPMSDLHIIL